MQTRGGNTDEKEWAGVRLFYVTRTVFVTSVLLLSYFLLPATQIMSLTSVAVDNGGRRLVGSNGPFLSGPRESGLQSIPLTSMVSFKHQAEVPTRIRGFERNEE